MYWTKARERIGPLKTEAGEITENGEEMSNLFNDYFLLVFTRENQDTMPTGEEVFQEEDNEKLRDAIMTRHVVQKETEKWNRLSSHVVNANTIDTFKKRLDKYMDGKDRW